jgi:hypothetical protein
MGRRSGEVLDWSAGRLLFLIPAADLTAELFAEEDDAFSLSPVSISASFVVSI